LLLSRIIMLQPMHLRMLDYALRNYL
jgi:hypothetical protein